jgi:hypothetical protein
MQLGRVEKENVQDFSGEQQFVCKTKNEARCDSRHIQIYGTGVRELCGMNLKCRSQNKGVYIATGHRLDSQEVSVRVLIRSRRLHIVQAGSGANPTSYAIRTGGYFHGGKESGA